MVGSGIGGTSCTRNSVPVGHVRRGIPDARLSLSNPQGSPEVALNQKVKNLIQKLGEAIHESVSESEDIAGVVKNIREQGFDVLLLLEATIGLNEVAEDDASSSETIDADSTDTIRGPFTSNDLNFLKSLRISLTEDSEPGSVTAQEPDAPDTNGS
jgi:hypothetical protein